MSSRIPEVCRNCPDRAETGAAAGSRGGSLDDKGRKCYFDRNAGNYGRNRK
mgnify:CR=1 FL=1